MTGVVYGSGRTLRSIPEGDLIGASMRAPKRPTQGQSHSAYC
jgi:hypothetical protein